MTWTVCTSIESTTRRFAQSGQDAGSGANVGYNDVSLERFRRRYNLPAGSVPAPADAAWNDWRRDQVTALVRRLYLEALAIKPRLIVSAAVVAIGDAPVNEGAWAASDAHGRVFQDWRAWTEEGIVDLVVPMVYRAEHTQAGAESFDGWVAWTRTHQYGRHAAVGLGAYLNSVEGTVRQARRALEPAGTPLRGVVLYSLGAHNAPVTNNPFAGSRDTPYRAFDDVAAGLATGRTTSGQPIEPSTSNPAVFAQRVPVPTMPWKASPDRGHVKGVVVSGDHAIDGAEVTLESEDGRTRDRGPAKRWERILRARRRPARDLPRGRRATGRRRVSEPLHRRGDRRLSGLGCAQDRSGGSGGRDLLDRCTGHSHAAPLTPLESPCAARTSRVSTRSENTQSLHSAGTRSIQPVDVRHAAAQDDDVWVEDVDDAGEPARQPILVPGERLAGLRVARARRELQISCDESASPVRRACSPSNPGPERNVSMQPVRPQ